MPETSIPRPSPLPVCPSCRAAVYSVWQDVAEIAYSRPAHPKLMPPQTPIRYDVTLRPCGHVLEYLEAEEYVAEVERSRRRDAGH